MKFMQLLLGGKDRISIQVKPKCYVPALFSYILLDYLNYLKSVRGANNPIWSQIYLLKIYYNILLVHVVFLCWWNGLSKMDLTKYSFRQSIWYTFSPVWHNLYHYSNSIQYLFLAIFTYLNSPSFVSFYHLEEGCSKDKTDMSISVRYIWLCSHFSCI